MTEKLYVVFWKYVKQYRYLLLMFIIFTGIFAGIFSLYSLEAEAVLYAAGLCLLLAAAVLSVNFVFYLKRHKERLELLMNAELIAETLPAAKTLAEQDYLDIIARLKSLLDESIVLRKNDKKESTEYYTAWVHQIKRPFRLWK